MTDVSPTAVDNYRASMGGKIDKINLGLTIPTQNQMYNR